MAEKKKSTGTKKSTGKKSQKAKKPSIIAIVFIAVAIYLVYTVIFSIVNRVETETAQMVTISDTVSTVGVAVRNETIITSDVRGVTVSVVENGGKVFKGETVVNVFDSEASAQAHMRMQEIDEALEEFESMKNAGEENASEISSIEKQTNNRLLALSGSVYNGDVPSALELADDILYMLNKGQIATKQVDNFDARVSELEAEKAKLMQQYSNLPESLKSPFSGYYISNVDGYENLLNTSVLEGLTPEKLESIMAGHSDIIDPAVIGKIADDYIWNIVCTVTAEEAEKFNQGSFYTIYLPYSDTESIEAKLISINPGADENALLVFRCSYMVSELASFRSQPIIIQIKKFTGLGVSRSAIDTITETVASGDEAAVSGSDAPETAEVTGVYIMWGNEVKFCKINEIYRDGDTVVCSIETERGWLKMYDSVITDTEGMYDGKIINAS